MYRVQSSWLNFRSMLKLASYSLTRKTLPAFQHPSCNIQATDVSMSYRIYFQL